MTPRTDREVYRASAADIGFEVVNPALARELEEKYRAALRALIIARDRIRYHDIDLIAPQPSR
jgi:hypothetical protein